VFDYTRKRGVEHSEIVLPTSAAQRDINWARDRQALWNAAEAAENRSNSRVAREYELALPHELNHAQRVELVRAFSADIANRYGVGVDFAIHAPHWNGDDRNHHAHVLTTTRKIEADGLGQRSEIEWSDTNRRNAGLVSGEQEITAIRERWETLTNEYLQAHGIDARIDHRSLEAQGIEREPQSH
jgi:ATP-dependent exoDNAse (exonuclease V) alpha subunit